MPRVSCRFSDRLERRGRDAQQAPKLIPSCGAQCGVHHGVEVGMDPPDTRLEESRTGRGVHAPEPCVVWIPFPADEPTAFESLDHPRHRRRFDLESLREGDLAETGLRPDGEEEGVLTRVQAMGRESPGEQRAMGALTELHGVEEGGVVHGGGLRREEGRKIADR
jgi:hypothetical protein